jgi:hypothetical protein
MNPSGCGPAEGAIAYFKIAQFDYPIMVRPILTMNMARAAKIANRPQIRLTIGRF